VNKDCCNIVITIYAQNSAFVSVIV